MQRLCDSGFTAAETRQEACSSANTVRHPLPPALAIPAAAFLQWRSASLYAPQDRTPNPGSSLPEPPPGLSTRSPVDLKQEAAMSSEGSSGPQSMAHSLMGTRTKSHCSQWLRHPKPLAVYALLCVDQTHPRLVHARLGRLSTTREPPQPYAAL